MMLFDGDIFAEPAAGVGVDGCGGATWFAFCPGFLYADADGASRMGVPTLGVELCEARWPPRENGSSTGIASFPDGVLASDD